MTDPKFNPSGAKYLREVPCMVEGHADVYAVLDAFEVTCPARQHATKKLLLAGERGKNSEIDDLIEARDAVDRAVQMCNQRMAAVDAAEERCRCAINAGRR